MTGHQTPATPVSGYLTPTQKIILSVYIDLAVDACKPEAGALASTIIKAGAAVIRPRLIPATKHDPYGLEYQVLIPVSDGGLAPLVNVSWSRLRMPLEQVALVVDGLLGLEQSIRDAIPDDPSGLDEVP